MKQEKFDSALATYSDVDGKIVKAFSKRAFASTALVPIAAALGGGTGWLISSGTPAVIACGALLSGWSAAFLVAKQLAKSFATVAGQPIEMLTSHLVMEGEQVDTELSLLTSPKPHLQQIEADLELLRQRFAIVTGRAREAMVELEAAREQANLQNIAKSQFLANMSHELRTPLNAVLGYAMLLHEDAVTAGNESAIADLDRIQFAGRHLLTLINDLLDLSKIETGRSTVDKSVIDVDSLVRACCAQFDDPAVRKGVNFSVEIDENIGVMIGDEIKIRQCLANILSNAFKFTQQGKVSFTVSIRRSAGVADRIVFSIADTGIGFDASKREILFESFAQADETSTRRFGGTGLGLAITRRYARLMDGDIEVESTPGMGSEFKLVLPVNPATGALRYSSNDGVEQPLVSSVASEFLPLGGGRSALVIDDNEAALDLMRRWLTRLDYEVVTAKDGEAGIEEAQRHDFDLIILDVLMPGRSGYDVLTQLRSNTGTSNTPIILVTVEDDRARGLGAGATEYVRKPVAEQQLRDLLEVYQTPARGDVLVIEDDDDAAELVMRCAKQVGFATRRAEDGAVGLKMAGDLRPSAIVLDLAMPRFDGFRVMDALSADPTLCNVPVIILSAREISMEDHQKIADRGYRFCMKGALSPREIAAHLKEMVA
jgi:signal transduction histidine kinase/DNA-binding response OmpR family regulator